MNDSAETGSTAAAAVVRGKSLLLVEDHELVRRLTTRSLAALGLNVTAVETSDEACEFFEQGNSVDFVITDVRLPGRMDGVALADWIRERFENTRVVLTTGFEEPHSNLAFPILTKPFSRDMLIECLVDAAGE